MYQKGRRKFAWYRQKVNGSLGEIVCHAVMDNAVKAVQEGIGLLDHPDLAIMNNRSALWLAAKNVRHFRR